VEREMKALAAIFQAGFLPVCTKIETEIAKIENESEKAEFLAELGIESPGVERLIRRIFKLLGMRTFFTGGDKEVRAWTLKRAGTAVDAAASVHSDLAKGFVRAEVYDSMEVIRAGGFTPLRNTDKMKLVGKEYEVQDGDYLLIRSSL